MVALFVLKSRANFSSPQHNTNNTNTRTRPHPYYRPRRSNPNRRTSTSSSCAPVKRILGKQQRVAGLHQQMRAPLLNKSAIVNRGSSVSSVEMPPTLTATTMTGTTAATTGANTRVRLPRTLPRPALREIDMSIIEDAFPNLKGVPPQYVRDNLATVAPHMLAALRNVRTRVSSSTLPSELNVELSPESEEARANPPTHMLAVYSASSSPSSSTSVSSPATGKTKVTLFPSHQLVFSAHCANLPALPSSQPSSSSDTGRRLPVVPFRLPVPAAFPLLYSYLYTKRADVLLSALESEHENDMASLTRTAALIQGLWQNTCVLGVVDNVLYDTLDFAWGRVMTALENAQSLS